MTPGTGGSPPTGATGEESERGRHRSLGTRIALWYGGLVALCLVAYSVAVVVFFTRHAEAELDRRVHEDVELAERAVTVSDSGLPVWRGGNPPWSGVHEEEGGGHWLEVWSLDGRRRFLSDGTVESVDLGPVPQDHLTLAKPHTHVLPTGPIRVLAEKVTLGETPFLLRVAVSEASSRQQVRQMWLEVMALSLAVLAFGGLSGRWLAGKALASLSDLAERSQRITADHLHERLPAGGSRELDQLSAAFNDTLARLEGSFDHLKRFTADVSHELRTPLTALRAVGEVALRRDHDEEGYREVIGSMLEEVDRLTRLTDELLALARADAGEAKLRLEPVDLGALVREVAGHLSVLSEEKEQTLEVDVAPLSVQADRTVLRQALVNLAVNAIKYSPGHTRIRLATGRRGGAAVLEVADEGPGIAPEHRARIFERFYRVDKSRSREMGGTGLGLALVKWAAEAHGGRVELESEPGRGSTFRIVLPS